MQKTRIVEVTDVRLHPIYNKTYKVKSRILAHDDKDEYQIGEMVEIASIRPRSRKKAWKIIGKIK